MLLIAVALCFFGMFLMFFYIVFSQDRVVRTLNKKYKEFYEQLSKIESAANAIYFSSNRPYTAEDTFSMQQSQSYPKRNAPQPVVNQNIPSPAMMQNSSPMANQQNLTQPMGFNNNNNNNRNIQSAQPQQMSTVGTGQVQYPQDVSLMQTPNNGATMGQVMIEDIFPLQQDMITGGPEASNSVRPGEQRMDKSSMLELLQL